MKRYIFIHDIILLQRNSTFDLDTRLCQFEHKSHPKPREMNELELTRYCKILD